MSKVRTHKDLDVWKEVMALTKGIYSLTRDFPKEEIYGLVSQMRRSAISVPGNIAEGAARGSRKDFKGFYPISPYSARVSSGTRDPNAAGQRSRIHK